MYDYISTSTSRKVVTDDQVASQSLYKENKVSVPGPMAALPLPGPACHWSGRAAFWFCCGSFDGAIL